jgi:hypothetical protein
VRVRMCGQGPSVWCPCKRMRASVTRVYLPQAALLTAVKSRAGQGDTCCSHTALLGAASALVTPVLPQGPATAARAEALLEDRLAALCASGLVVRARGTEVDGEDGTSYYTTATWACESQVWG